MAQERPYQEQGARLKAMLRERRIKANDLAAQAGIHHGSISRYVGGFRRPDAEHAIRIAEALGISPAELRPDLAEAFRK
jgi:transcriptional regulator with XRE-family HTH domain